MKHAVHIIIPKSIELPLNSIAVIPIFRAMNVMRKAGCGTPAVWPTEKFNEKFDSLRSLWV